MSVYGLAVKVMSVRAASLVHVTFEAIAVVFAAVVFPTHDTSSNDTRTLAFMGAVVASRVGLYGFDVGVLTTLTRPCRILTDDHRSSRFSSGLLTRTIEMLWVQWSML